MERCTKCIIPVTAKGIVLDENGLCQLCKNFRKVESKGEISLREEISKYIENKEEYNCIVPVSGGRDSSYALYFAKEVLKLNPIAVHNDNDFEKDWVFEQVSKTSSYVYRQGFTEGNGLESTDSIKVEARS